MVLARIVVGDGKVLTRIVLNRMILDEMVLERIVLDSQSCILYIQDRMVRGSGPGGCRKPCVRYKSPDISCARGSL